MKKILWVTLITVVILAGLGLLYKMEKAPAPVVQTPPREQTANPVGLANPASVNCKDKGGDLKMMKKADGGEYGICYFEDNRQCEEWALFRGECPVGGLRVIGYDNEEQVYCAITGGAVDMQKQTCTKAGTSYSLTQYFAEH
jgi:putative hemolysin